MTYADEHVILEKGSSAIAPYLDIEQLTNVAVECDIDFVHPGEFCSHYVAYDMRNCI